jgi:L-arabinokinase
LSRAIESGATHGLADAEAFVREAGRSPFFEAERGLVVARAPGRLDLMGGIADYSGSLVLQWPLSEATLAAVQLTGDRTLRVASLAGHEGGSERAFAAALGELFPGGAPLDEDAARAWFGSRAGGDWAAYALGALIVLARAKGVRLEGGLRLLLRSSVPEGRGVSSSAALEVAAMQALVAALDVEIDPRGLAVLCQRVENRVVGAACGVMDQMTAACGRAGELLALLCQPAEVQGTIAVPESLEIWGIDSGVRHAVSGSDYTGVRVGAFMGARMLADLAGLEVEGGALGEPVRVADTRWRGYLANLTPAELDGEFLGRLPERMAGAAFLARYGGTADPVTRVDPTREYPVRAATAHPVYEHHRVRRFAELLRQPLTAETRAELGAAMYASHASYSACGLGCDATDSLVALVREAGPERGFLGAKITGGGCGGTVAVLGLRGADIGSIASAIAGGSGRPPRVFSGSSPGAAAFGAIRLSASPAA